MEGWPLEDPPKVLYWPSVSKQGEEPPLTYIAAKEGLGDNCCSCVSWMFWRKWRVWVCVNCLCKLLKEFGVNVWFCDLWIYTIIGEERSKNTLGNLCTIGNVTKWNKLRMKRKESANLFRGQWSLRLGCAPPWDKNGVGKRIAPFRHYQEKVALGMAFLDDDLIALTRMTGQQYWYKKAAI